MPRGPTKEFPCRGSSRSRYFTVGQVALELLERRIKVWLSHKDLLKKYRVVVDFEPSEQLQPQILVGTHSRPAHLGNRYRRTQCVLEPAYSR